MELCTGHVQMLDLVKAVDRTMAEFRLDTFYKVSDLNSAAKLVCV